MRERLTRREPSPAVTTKPPFGRMTVGAIGDVMEQEAERVAGHTTAMSRPALLHRPGDPPPMSVDDALRMSGEPLAPAHRANVERRFGLDLSGVRVHTGSAAARSAADLQSQAYTVGEHMVFGAGRFAPETIAGRNLIAHELTHVAQHARPVTGPITRPGVIRRAISPEDVAEEMVGQTFELAAVFTSGAFTFGKGVPVLVSAWDNTSPTVSAWALVMVAGIPLPWTFDVPKTLLRPIRPGGTKLDPYSTGIDAQARVVEKGEAAVAAATGAEKTRLEGLLVTRRKLLNQKLIQETMYNRFDPIIAKEVEDANKAHGLTGADALDPDLVKAMLFQESEIGTSGTHLEVPPSHPVKTRFNVGQVIDSSGMALLTMLEAEQPALITSFSLTNLRSDLAAAQTELATLRKKATRTPAESARMADLQILSGGFWETFIWSYRASGAAVGFSEAVDAFFAASSPAANMDYTFWIHMAVLWLFEKKKPGRTWLETIKAYNGSGARADHYRDAVATRASGAATAAAAGTPFTPTR